ncbi:MAG: GHMP kinase, partial [Halobacteria archaeon]|nr:GHMP kinase [Halobacteria archaeon]
FTSESPARGEWEVPPVVSHHDVPPDWRFVVAVPEGKGKHGESEDESIRDVISRADPSIADEISSTIVDEVLPGITTGDIKEFGAGIERVGRLNGAWYTSFQGGVYRKEALPIVQKLREHPDVAGVGQSSWGPAVYGL